MTDEQIDRLAAAIRSIASGNDAGPCGLEGIGIALGGDGLKQSVAGSILELAVAVNDLAEAVRGR